jgi:hypothetical protein
VNRATAAAPIAAGSVGIAGGTVSAVVRWNGDVHLTSRAILQLPGLPSGSDGMTDQVVGAIESTGLLPSRSHDVVRNVMVSPRPG